MVEWFPEEWPDGIPSVKQLLDGSASIAFRIPTLKERLHLLVTLGATGAAARQIRRIFNISTAGSKVVQCTLHNFHVEGREQDIAYAEFKRTYCDFCPDKKPRPGDWRYVGDVRAECEANHRDFVIRLAGTSYGIRFTNED